MKAEKQRKGIIITKQEVINQKRKKQQKGGKKPINLRSGSMGN